jgi:DNA-binding MarR family transcriptional regulator
VARVSRAELAQDVLTAARRYLEEWSDVEQFVAEMIGVGRTEMRCLGLLERHGGRLTAGRLADLSHLTTGAITGVVDRLERAGLARREADPTDRRRVIVVMDEVAHARGDEAFLSLVDAQTADLMKMSLVELRAVRSFLTRAAEHTARHAESLKGELAGRRMNGRTETS